MIFLKRITELLSANRAAVEQNEAAKEDADRSLEMALVQLEQATVQAQKLTGMDNRNHYSESLTYAFRGRTT